MSAPTTTLQMSMSPDGHLLTASSGENGPSLTVERDTFDSGYRAILRFISGSEPVLTVVAEIGYGDDGSIVQSSIATDGSGIDHEVTLVFAEDPRNFFSGGKLEAGITVESNGTVHHGQFDGQTWHAIGLEGAPSLPGLLATGEGALLASLRPALDVLIAGAQRRSGGAFSSSPGRPPSLALAAPGMVEPASTRGQACRAACAAAGAATGVACCAAAAGAPPICAVCYAAAAAATSNCMENCPD